MAIKKRYGSLVKGPVISKSPRKTVRSANKEFKDLINIKVNSTSIPLLKLPNYKTNNPEMSKSMLKFKKNETVVIRNTEALNKLPYFTRKVIPVRNLKREMMKT